MESTTGGEEVAAENTKPRKGEEEIMVKAWCWCIGVCCGMTAAFVALAVPGLWPWGQTEWMIMFVGVVIIGMGLIPVMLTVD